MNSDDDIIDVTCEPASAWDQFFLAWGLESLKGSVPALNDVLGRLLTLNSALIGGGFLALKGDVVPYWWAVAAVGCLMVSLVTSLVGLIPVSRSVRLNDPIAIREAEVRAANRKEVCLLTAFVGLAAGFSLAFCGVIAKGP